MSRRLRIGAAQWPIERHASFAGWCAKLESWLAAARAQGAQLAVLPEYGAMELTSLWPDELSLEAQLEALQPLVEEVRQACASGARRHGLYLVSPSLPERAEVRYVNRLRVHSPRGHEVVVEKRHMTRFERESWGIVGGAQQPVIETELATFGVAICYDSEFPLQVRQLVEAGAELVLVPSCTDSLAGYHRVRVACQARALESQCVIVQSPTVGLAPWSKAVDENHGAAGCFGPPDRGFPEDGVLALGRLDQPEWLFCDVDLDAIAAVRADGAVLNHRDWSAEPADRAPPPRRVAL